MLTLFLYCRCQNTPRTARVSGTAPAFSGVTAGAGPPQGVYMDGPVKVVVEKVGLCALVLCVCVCVPVPGREGYLLVCGCATLSALLSAICRPRLPPVVRLCENVCSSPVLLLTGCGKG